jgi:hypothetical protein
LPIVARRGIAVAEEEPPNYDNNRVVRICPCERNETLASFTACHQRNVLAATKQVRKFLPKAKKRGDDMLLEPARLPFICVVEGEICLFRQAFLQAIKIRLAAVVRVEEAEVETLAALIEISGTPGAVSLMIVWLRLLTGRRG